MAQLAAVGANSQINYVEETSFGVTPTTPTMKIVRATLGAKFDLKRDTFVSKEMNSARQVMSLNYGNRSGSGTIPFELSYGSFDDFLSAVMGGTQTWGGGNILKIGNAKRSFTFEQQYPDINTNEINTGVVLTDFSLTVKPGAVVTGSFTHQFKDQKFVQTINDATGTGAMAFTATTITRVSGSFVTDGYAIGDSITTLGATTAVNNKTAVITTVAALTLTLSGAGYTVDAAAQPNLVIAKTLGTATAINTNSVFDSFTGSMSVNAATVAIITGIDLKLAQTASASKVLFDATTQQISLGTVSVTGTMTVRFVSNALKGLWLAGSTADCSFILGATSKMYTFDLSSVKFTDVGNDSPEGELTQSIPFQATYNSGDLSSLMITRTP